MDDEWYLESIVKAKQIVAKHYCGYAGTSEGINKRKWIELTGKSSYEDEKYEVNLFVLEGSPPKGYVFASKSIELVVAFSNHFRRLKTFDFWTEEIPSLK
jgi:hypothetical protein